MGAILTFIVILLARIAMTTWFMTLGLGIIHLHGFPEVPALGWNDSFWVALALNLVFAGVTVNANMVSKTTSD